MDFTAFEKHLDSIKKREAAQTSTAALLGTSEPDAMAEAVSLGTQLGVPAGVVTAAPDVFRQQAAQKAATAALENAPKVSAWLRDPINGALGKDDLEQLTLLERELGPIARAAGRGVRRIPAIPETASTTLLAGQAGDIGKTYDDIYAEEIAKFPGSAGNPTIQADARRAAQLRFDRIDGLGAEAQGDIVQRGAEALSNARTILDDAAAIPMSDTAAEFRDVGLAAAENTIMGVFGAFAADPVGGAAFIVETAAETLPLLVASTGVTAATRSPAAGAATMGAGSFLLENSNSAMEFLQEEGVDLSSPEAAMEVLQNPELMAAASERGVTRGVIIALFDAVSGGVAGQTLLKSPAGDVVAQGIAQAVMGSGGETAAQVGAGQEISVADIVIEGLAEFATAPIEMGGVAGRAFLTDGVKARAAGATRKTLEKVQEIAGASKLKERAPQQFKDLMADLSDDFLYVPADDFATFYQAKDLTAEDAADLYNLDIDELMELSASGGTVAVPASTFASDIAGTEDAEWFMANSVMDPDEMSEAEAARFNEEVSDVMAAAFEDAETQRLADLEVRASDTQVYDGAYSQLRAAGRTKDVAENEARVMTAFFRTMSERYGEDALDLSRRFGLTIRGPETDPARSRDNMDIALNTLRGGKVRKATGQSLSEFVRTNGGVRDDGGDVEALEGPSGLISETRAQITARMSQATMEGLPDAPQGMGIDEMASLAVQNGYAVPEDVAGFIEALREDIADGGTYREGEGPDTSLDGLRAEIEAAGLDLDAMDNDAVIAALDDPKGQDRSSGSKSLIGWHFEIKVGSYSGGATVTGFDGDVVLFDLDAGRKGEIPLSDLNGGLVKFVGEDAYPFSDLEVATEEKQLPLSELTQKILMIAREDGQLSKSSLSVTHQKELEAAGFSASEEGIYRGAADALADEAARRNENGTWDETISIYSPVDDAAIDQKILSLQEKTIVSKSPKGATFNQDGTRNIDTPEFKAWFGDSQVVDENGEPVAMWHGSSQAGFGQFQTSGQGKSSDTGAFFTESVRGASTYSGTNDEFVPATVDQVAADPEKYGITVEENEDGTVMAYSPAGYEYSGGTLREALDDMDANDGMGDEARGNYQVYLSLKNPKIIDAEGKNWDSIGSTEEFFVEDAEGEVVEYFTNREDAEAWVDDNIDEYDDLNVVEGFDDMAAASTDDLVREAREEGYDGVIFENIIDEGPHGQGHGWDNKVAVAFDSTQIKSVHNRGTFDPDDARILYQGESDKRGSIQFPRGGLEDGQTVINLFESADLSTVLHESGHYFLEAFSALVDDTAPEQMRTDMAAIRDFLGAEEGKPFNTEQHEKWARGFEAYLLEGKAPSLELADAFGRFKAWLTRIYKSVAGLNVKLTPEIREVMDRMLATDAEIAAARETQQMDPMFADQAAAGMSDAAWSTYQRMARRSSEQASQKLLEKTMDKVRREKQRWWKDERAELRKGVEQAVNGRPEHRLIEMLANGQYIGSDDAVPDIQMDRQELVDTFGEGVLVELNRTRLGGKRAIYAKGGASLSEVAEFFGFSGPSDMVKVLQNTGKRKDAIEQETDRIMNDRYGDPLNDGTIEQEALDAIHSEQQANTVASEVRHLAGKAGLPTRNLTAKVFRQRARMMMGRMSVREATRPDAFLAAGRKATKRAEEAFARVAKGDANALATAAKHKEQQLLNHYLYMEARDLEKWVGYKREKMRQYGKKAVRAKLDGGYIEQIDTLLDQYDFRKRSPGQITGDESLTAFVQRMEAEGRIGEVSIDDRVIANAKRVHYSRLSVSELQGLVDTIDNIDHLGRHKKKLRDAADQRDLDEIVEAITEQFAENVDGTPPSRTPDAGEARKKGVRDFLNTTLNADTLLREVDGFADLGPTWMAMKSKIDQGMGRLQERRVEMANAFDAIYDVYSAKEKRDMSQKVQNEALGVPMSKWDLIALALNTGNQDNFERLTNPKVKGSFPQGGIEAALTGLDERDWRTVQAIWDHIDSYWSEIEAKEKRQTGIAPPKVDNKLMVNAAPGFVKGGYYPIKYDARLSGLTDDFQMKDLGESLMGGRFGKAQTRNGHTKERGKSSRQPVQLDLGVAHAHVEQVLYDLEIGEPVTASWRILQDSRVRAAFIESGKQSDFDALELWLQDVASGERIAAGGFWSLMRHVRTGFTVSRLALNVSTALIQPTGLVQSMVVVGKGAVARGTVDYMSNIGKWVTDVNAASPMMRERQTTFERDIFNVVGDLEGGPVTGRWSKFQRDVVLPLSFVMMQKVQFYAVDMPTWVSAYQKEVKASGDEAKARLYADTMVKRAQGSGLMSDRGMFERGTLGKGLRQHEAPKMLTALGSYMFAKGNVAYEQFSKTDFKSPAQVMSLAVDVALLFTLEAVLYSAVKGYLPDEDDEEGAAKWAIKETAFSAMSTLPFMREVSGAMQGFNGGGIFGSTVEALVKPMIQAEQGEADKAFVKSVLDAGGIMLHLPASQTKSVVDAFFDTDMSLRDDPNPLQALGLGGGRGRSLADIMFGE